MPRSSETSFKQYGFNRASDRLAIEELQLTYQLSVVWVASFVCSIPSNTVRLVSEGKHIYIPFNSSLRGYWSPWRPIQRLERIHQPTVQWRLSKISFDQQTLPVVTVAEVNGVSREKVNGLNLKRLSRSLKSELLTTFISVSNG